MPFYDFQCEKCEKELEIWQWIAKKPVEQICESCGVPMERDYSREHGRHVPANGYPYVTENITGSPIEVRSPAHEAELCKTHNVRKRDDSSFLEKTLGIETYHDSRGRLAQRPTYSEGSGRGLPGQWT